MGFIRWQDSVGKMRALSVLVSQPFSDVCLDLGAPLEGVEVYAFVLQKPPQAPDHAVFDPPPFAVHADLDLCFGQHVGPCTAGELAALVGFEDLRQAMFWQ